MVYEQFQDSYTMRDGFLFTSFYSTNQDNKNHDALVICDNNFKKYSSYIKENNIVKLIIDVMKFRPESLSFLNDFSDIEFLSINGRYENHDLYTLTSLKHLSILRNISPLELSRFPKLKSLSIADCLCNKITLSKYHANLESIDICSLSDKFNDRDLQFMTNAKHLKVCRLIHTNITSLEFIQGLKELRSLSINVSRRLCDISSLKFLSKSITRLDFQYCPKITDFSILGQLMNLQYLRLHNTRPNSVQFIKDLGNMRTFVAAKSEILDRNITSLTNLEFAWIDTMKKDYYIETKSGIVQAKRDHLNYVNDRHNGDDGIPLEYRHW